MRCAGSGPSREHVAGRGRPACATLDAPNGQGVAGEVISAPVAGTAHVLDNGRCHLVDIGGVKRFDARSVKLCRGRLQGVGETERSGTAIMEGYDPGGCGRRRTVVPRRDQARGHHQRCRRSGGGSLSAQSSQGYQGPTSAVPPGNGVGDEETGLRPHPSAPARCGPPPHGPVCGIVGLVLSRATPSPAPESVRDVHRLVGRWHTPCCATRPAWHVPTRATRRWPASRWKGASSPPYVTTGVLSRWCCRGGPVVTIDEDSAPRLQPDGSDWTNSVAVHEMLENNLRGREPTMSCVTGTEDTPEHRDREIPGCARPNRRPGARLSEGLDI